MSECVLPAGTLLCHLDQIAASLNLTAECDNLLRWSIPARCASNFVWQLTEGGFPDAPPDNDWNGYITASISDAQVRVDSTSSGLFVDFVKNYHSNPDIASCCSVVQVMELIDEFSSQCGLSTIGEQELKFGVPIDHLCGLMCSLVGDSNFLVCEKRDFFVVSKCKSIRHKFKIGLSDHPLLSIAKINRSAQSTPSVNDGNSFNEQYRFTESFPLYQKTILKHTPPEVVLALPLAAIEGIVVRWMKQFNSIDHAKFTGSYPIDSVVRAIRAHPNSLRQAKEFIFESMKTKPRFKYCSIVALRDMISKIVIDHNLSAEVEHVLLSEISATYAYLIVSKQINKADSRALSKSGKWITVGRLKPFSTRRKTPNLEFDVSEEPNAQADMDCASFDV